VSDSRKLQIISFCLPKSLLTLNKQRLSIRASLFQEPLGFRFARGFVGRELRLRRIPALRLSGNGQATSSSNKDENENRATGL